MIAMPVERLLAPALDEWRNGVSAAQRRFGEATVDEGRCRRHNSPPNGRHVMPLIDPPPTTNPGHPRSPVVKIEPMPGTFLNPADPTAIGSAVKRSMS